jgi:hypothetical protein
MYPVIPDAVFALRRPHRRNFAIEYDRATETLSVLVAKICAYEHGFPGFPFEAVLIVTEGDRRMDGLTREIRKRGVSLRVVVGTLGSLQANNIVDWSFLDLVTGTSGKLVEPVGPADLSSHAVLP